MGQFRDVQSFVKLSKEATTPAALRSLLEGASHTFGFRYFVLGHHVSVLSGSLVHLSNYPLTFADAVRTKGHFSNDPVVRACQTTVAGFRWSDLPNLIPFSKKQEEILLSASRAGIGEGYTVPANVPGECVGSCSFAVKAGRLIDTRVLPAVQYIGSFAFEAARRLAVNKASPSRSEEPPPSLTPRQMDCLVLIAQGKSDWDTGKLLGLSDRTVHEYVEAAKGKYGVASRVQLVIRALFDNQLGFEDIIRH